MRIVIQVAKKDRAKAWGVLARHSSGTALPEGTFIVSANAVAALRDARVKFKEVSREPGEPSNTGAIAGERI